MLKDMIFFTGKTALEYWRKVERLNLDRPQVAYANDRLPILSISSQDVLAASSLFSESLPVEVAIANSACKCNSRKIRCYMRSGTLPKYSFFRIAKRTYVASPRLVFLELAHQLDVIQLAQVGCELASRYILDEYDMRGFRISEPLLNSVLLKSYLDRMEKWPGIKKARKAVKYVFNEAASPMETKIALRLCLPRNMGGFGLPRPKLNHKVNLNQSQYMQCKKHSVVFDFYWTEGKLDVEYDSDVYHASAQKLQDDSVRRNIIKALNYDTITITSKEYNDLASMVSIARNIARKIGYRFQNPSIEEYSKMLQLKQTLDSKL